MSIDAILDVCRQPKPPKLIRPLLLATLKTHINRIYQSDRWFKLWSLSLLEAEDGLFAYLGSVGATQRILNTPNSRFGGQRLPCTLQNVLSLILVTAAPDSMTRFHEDNDDEGFDDLQESGSESGSEVGVEESGSEEGHPVT